VIPALVRRRSLARLSAAVALALVALGASPASPVAAHAELVRSTPTPNASLPVAPDELLLEFSEAIDDATARVDLVDVLGMPVSGLGAVAFDGDLGVRVALPDLAPATYTVRYQVVSAVDGHATTGSFAFVVDPTGAVAPPVGRPQSSSPSVDLATILARWVALIALLVVAGTLMAWWLTLRPIGAAAPWGLVAAGAALGSLGTVAYLWLAARPIGAGAGTGIPFDVAGPFGWSPFAIAMRVTVVAAAMLALLALSVRRDPGPSRGVVAALLAAVALAGMSAAGHAASIGGPGFAIMDWLHLVAVAAWLGALPALLLAGRSAGVGGVLRRHGRVAIVAAPVVALTGIANSPLVLGTGRDLVASDYGNLLVAKATLLAVALGIGAVNHLALRGRGRAAVAGLVAAELVIGVLAVSAAATMVTIQPASARQPVLSARPATPAHLFGDAGPVRVHATVQPAAPGTQTVQVTLTDAISRLPRDDIQRAFASFTAPDGAGLDPVRVPLTPDPSVPGLFTARGTFATLVGTWDLDIVVRRAGALDDVVAFEVPIEPPTVAELVPPADTGIGVPAPFAVAWSLVPRGVLGWLVPLIGLVALGALGRASRRGNEGWSRAGRAVLGVFVVGSVLVVGSRALVDAANAAPATAAMSDVASPSMGADAVASGELVYRANCASCHGVDGDGDGPIRTLPAAGPLARAVRDASDAALAYRIAYGVAGTSMPPFAGQLTVDERLDLIAYLRSRWGSP
jgi:copper transport protein